MQPITAPPLRGRAYKTPPIRFERLVFGVGVSRIELEIEN